jgi:Domain of unknown function (DUF4342)
MTDLHNQETTLQDSPTAPEVVPNDIPTSTDFPHQEDIRVEEFKISGDALVSKVKEFIHEGNIRRIVIKTEEGNTLIEIPLTVGVVGGVLATSLFPVVAAVGAIGALVAHLTIVIEKQV